MARSSFDVVPVQGLTFGGPSAEWLMRVISAPGSTLGFDYGMLPGVFVGSLIGALVGREIKVEGFRDGYSMARCIAGAMAMGFGAIMAGGCAVGAGMSGGALFALTARLALAAMWACAGLADLVFDRSPAAASAPAAPANPLSLAVQP